MTNLIYKFKQKSGNEQVLFLLIFTEHALRDKPFSRKKKRIQNKTKKKEKVTVFLFDSFCLEINKLNILLAK